jgi:diguanylate cyclase (GGDEF)-like protein
MRILPRWCLLLFALALLPIAARAGVAPVEIGEGFRQQALAGHLDVLEDQTGRLDLAGARASTGFRAAPPGGLKIGFSDSAWWVRATLHNPGPKPRQLVLREAYPLMDSITLWAPRPDGGWRVVRTGDRLPFGSRDYPHHEFLFDLELPPESTQTVYLRFASGGPMDITLSLYSPNALAGTLGAEQLVYGAFYGGFLVLVLYNLFLCMVVRDRVFYWYLAYAVSFGLYFSMFNGLSFQYLWPDSPAWANRSVLVLIGATVFLGLQFTRRFLDTAEAAPRLDRFTRGLQALALAGIAAAFVAPYSLVIQGLAMLTVVAAVTIITLGSFGLLAGFQPARYFMAAWSLLLLGVLVTNLKNYGLLPHNLLTQNGFQIGSLCEMVLLSLGLATRVRDMERQSRIDALTRVFNRRYFDERVASELERALRTQAPISLLVADIDHFKRINDQFGHARGDEVLRAVARALREGVRAQDAVCRYGGEEFALILADTDARQAVAVAEGLRRAVAAVPGPEGTALSISIGVASTADGGIDGVIDLFHAADEALYKAKASGRNRVMRAQSMTSGA